MKLDIKSKKDYEIKKFSNYTIGDEALYREIIYFIRQYPMWKVMLKKVNADKEDISIQGVNLDSIISKTNKISRPTEEKAIKNLDMISTLELKIGIVEKALIMVREEYRQGILEHIVLKLEYTSPKFDYAHLNTWKYWNKLFIYNVGINLGYAEYIKCLKELKESEVI